LADIQGLKNMADKAKQRKRHETEFWRPPRFLRFVLHEFPLFQFFCSVCNRGGRRMENRGQTTIIERLLMLQ